MRMRLVLVGLATAALLDPTPILAQDASDIRHGREIAQTICALAMSWTRINRCRPTAKRHRFLCLLQLEA